MSTAIAKAFKPNPVMTLRELEAALVGFSIYLKSRKGVWIGHCSIAGVEARGSTPIEVVTDVLRQRDARMADTDNWRIEMADCENHLLREIADKQFKRRDVAQSYCLAMRSSEKVDWGKVNQAIIERWSHFGLEWIKRQAHTKNCFAPRPYREAA